jgi:hypothetical protein
MAHPTFTPGYDGTITPSAPTTSESFLTPDDNSWLFVDVGVTATTITIVRPGNDAVGVAVTDKVIGPLTSVKRFIKIDRRYKDPTTGNATVQFSQVTNVTCARVNTR